jgi:hypothetical protein
MPPFRYLLAGLLLASACMEPLDGQFVALQVNGSVRTPEGAPVAGATLDVRARIGATCIRDVDQGQATSSATGSFSRILGRFGEPLDVCVWIAVTPPAGSGLAADTLTVTPARLDVETNTLAVDIVLTELP